MPVHHKDAMLRWRARTVELHLQGLEQWQIAAQLALEGMRVTPQQVGLDLQRARIEWQQSSLQNTDEELGKAFATYALIQKEAWEGWRRSQQPKEVTVTEAIEQGDAPRRKASVRKEGQAGDPTFLTTVLTAKREEIALRGLMPAAKVKIDLDALTPAQLLRIANGEKPERVLAEAQDPPPKTIAQAQAYCCTKSARNLVGAGGNWPTGPGLVPPSYAPMS